MMAKTRLRWGVIGPGEIARAFGRDIHVNPETRGVTDIEHVVVAAASSSSRERAQAYLEYIEAPSFAKAYGSYQELVKDVDVDIVYIASPHSHHFGQAMMCIEVGKHVLCEKPITVNTTQLEKLTEAARAQEVFLMEAAWTRYMPASRYVQANIKDRKIGKVHRVFADLSSFTPTGTVSDGHRLLDPALAGGVLLDIGIYALTWAFMALYTTHPTGNAEPVLASSAVEKYKTGVDAQTSMIIRFPQDDAPAAHAIVTTSMLVSTEPATLEPWPAVRIQGSKGEIQIMHPIFRPQRTKIILNDGTVEQRDWTQPGPGKGSGWRNGFKNEFGGGFHAEGEGHGMFWEADECARALRGGKAESFVHPLSESLALMRIIDDVRDKHGLQFPETVETAKYSSSLRE